MRLSFGGVRCVRIEKRIQGSAAPLKRVGEQERVFVRFDGYPPAAAP